MKAVKNGAQRWISQLRLNSLYSYFGRSLNLLETKIIDKKGLYNLKIKKNRPKKKDTPRT